MKSPLTFACLLSIWLSAGASPSEANIRMARAGMDVGPGESTGEWPVLETGTWQLESTRILPGGRTQHWNETVSQCSDARALLAGYWGLGIVERAGCRQFSAKSNPTRFKIVSECMVRHIGKATSEAIVTVKSQDDFEVDVRVTEGKKKYRASQSGHRLSACDPTTEKNRGD